jgi:uncharacterized membrane protein (UPF0127 family)
MVAFLAMGPDDGTDTAVAAPRRRSRRVPQTVRVVAREGTVVCTRCEVAKRMIPRMRGLLGRDGLAPGEGMLLEPAPSIMTFFMRFPIDVVFVDKRQTIVKIAHSLKPWRMASARRAVASVELPAGTAVTHGLQVGDVLSFEPAHPEHLQ